MNAATEQKTVLELTTKLAKSNYISILTLFFQPIKKKIKTKFGNAHIYMVSAIPIDPTPSTLL